MTQDQIVKRKVDLANNIENAVEDLFNWEQLSVITQMVLNTNTIPFFKTHKFHMYYLAVNQFTQYQVANCDMSIDLFRRVIGINSTLIHKDVSYWEDHDKKENSRIISFRDTQE